MNLRVVTIGKLPEFVKSDEYARLEPKPITPLRALSQFRNPYARMTDPALVFAAENDVLLAFAGILPHKIPGETEPVYTNTCWWAHPKLGSNFAFPVFLKAFQLCNQRMIFTESTIRTKQLLEKTGLIKTYPPISGTRYFLRFYFGAIMMKKGKSAWICAAFSIVDKILNAFVSLRFPFLMNRKLVDSYSIGKASPSDTDVANFIEHHPGKSSLQQEATKLEWILNNPWITPDRNAPEISYPFSYRVKKFSQEILEIKKDSKIVAVLMLSIRDHLASVPFIYYDPDVLNDIAQLVWSLLVAKKVDSFVVFNTELRKALERNRRIWLFRKNIMRFASHSKQLNSIFTKKEFAFQDGEGDAVFT